MKALPDEVLCKILIGAILNPLLAPAEDDLTNNLKLLTDDCELLAEMNRTRAQLRGVCTLWRRIFDVPPHPFVILPIDADQIPPPCLRIQYTETCDCKRSGCLMAFPPPLTSYRLGNWDRGIEAFLDLSTESTRDVMQIIGHHPNIWLLAIAVDFTHSSHPFSLPTLSQACPNLTHLSLSEFYLPNSDFDQTLYLPRLNTLTLNFYCPGSVTLGQTTDLHISIQQWSLPQLRNLSLRGWVADDDEALLGGIHQLLQKVGRTLWGLLYNLWYRSPPDDALHPLPDLLWEWCPHLKTIQTSCRVLLTGPILPSAHPKLTVVPVHLGDLDGLPGAPHMEKQVWPRELFRLMAERDWPIERLRVSTTWATFYEKLRRIHEPESPSGQDTTYWPIYFSKWINLLRWKGIEVEDRYNVAVDSEDPSAQILFSWLQTFNGRPLRDHAGQW